MVVVKLPKPGEPARLLFEYSRVWKRHRRGFVMTPWFRKEEKMLVGRSALPSGKTAPEPSPFRVLRRARTLAQL